MKTLHVGQRVVVAFDIACDSCKRDESTCCDTTNPSELEEKLERAEDGGFLRLLSPDRSDRSREPFDLDRCLAAGAPGGQPDYVQVAFADLNCLSIPADVSDAKALYLSDIMPTASDACEIGNVERETRWCQILGAKRIIGIDCVAARLEIGSKQLGIETINLKEHDTTKKLLEMVRLFPVRPRRDDRFSRSPVASIVRSKRPVSMRPSLCCTKWKALFSIWKRTLETITCTRKVGTIALIGVDNNTVNHLPIGPMMEKHLTGTGGQSFTQKHCQMCLEKVRSGEMGPTFVVSHHLKWSQAPDDDNLFEKKANGAWKCFLRPDNVTDGK